MIFTPLFLKLRDFSISFPIFTSLTGSSDNEILIVSPIPSSKSVPKPIDDLILPEIKLPASVILGEADSQLLLKVVDMLQLKEKHLMI